MKKILIFLCVLALKAPSIFATEGILVTCSDSEETIELPLWVADQSEVLGLNLQNTFEGKTFFSLDSDQREKYNANPPKLVVTKEELQCFASYLKEANDENPIEKSLDEKEKKELTLKLFNHVDRDNIPCDKVKKLFNVDLALEVPVLGSFLQHLILSSFSKGADNAEENEKLNELLFDIYCKDKNYLKTLLLKKPIEFDLDEVIGSDNCYSCNFSTSGDHAAMFLNERAEFFSINKLAEIEENFSCSTSYSNSGYDCVFNNNVPLITFSSDEKKALFSSHKHPLQIIDLEATKKAPEKESEQLSGHGIATDVLENAVFSPRAQNYIIAYCSSCNRDAFLANYEKGYLEKLHNLTLLNKAHSITACTFSFDGTLLATAYLFKVAILKMSEDDKAVELLFTLDCGKQPVQSAIFSPKNKYIAITVGDENRSHDIIIYDLKGKNEIFRSEPLTTTSYCWFDSKEESVAIATKSNSVIEIWDLKSKTKKKEIILNADEKIKHATGHAERDMAMIISSKKGVAPTCVKFIPYFFGSYSAEERLKIFDKKILDDALIFVPNNPSVSASQFKKFIPLLKNVGFGILGIFVAYLGVKATAFISKAYRFNTPFNVQIRNLVTLFKNTGEEVFLKKLSAIYMRHAMHK